MKVYILRSRLSDSEPWSTEDVYIKRKNRDKDERLSRILGGIRVWTYEDTRDIPEGFEFADQE